MEIFWLCVSVLPAYHDGSLVNANGRGQTALHSNSNAYCVVHATLAGTNDIHCPHISYIAEADVDNLQYHESYSGDPNDFLCHANRAFMTLVETEISATGPARVDVKAYLGVPQVSKFFHFSAKFLKKERMM